MLSVLIADDDLVSREVLATVLTLNNYTVQAVASGEAAVEMVRSGEFRPRVVLLDARMPGLHGTELIGRLRGLLKDSGDAVIYAMSGSEVARDSIAGADGFLLKPFGVDELKRMLESGSESGAESSRKTAASAESGVVDAAKLEQLLGMMSETAVRAVFTAVVGDLRVRAEALQTAFEGGELEEVRRIGHMIRGSCGMVGASEAAEVGARLEGEGNYLNNSQLLMGQLWDAIRRLEGMLEVGFPAEHKNTAV